MLEAISRAQTRIELETYIFGNDPVGRQFLQALARAAGSGVQVRVLIDAYGSLGLSASFFSPLTQAGGQVRFFNPLRFSRFGVRDHRKLLVCDEQTAFIGGANIAKNYDGDGITAGWFDLVKRIDDAELARQLSAEFDVLFTNAAFDKYPRPRLRALRRLRRSLPHEPRLFAVKPGRGADAFQRMLQADLARAGAADFIVPYFLPPRRIRKLLLKVVKRGGRVRLILPSICDVPLARAAAMVFYGRLLRRGVEIYEYQPQILHAKLFLVDDKVYAGSANLDVRSFKLNYELMLRFTDPASVNGAREILARTLGHSQPVNVREFCASQTTWRRWKNRWAHFLLIRIDPLVALRQFQSLERCPPPRLKSDGEDGHRTPPHHPV